MKKEAILISIIIIGIAGLIFASRIWTPTPAEVAQEEPATQEEVVIEPALEVVTEPEKPAVPDGWQITEGENFSIQTPESWLISKSEITGTDFTTKLWLESGISNDAYIDPDIVTIKIATMPKGDGIFSEIIDLYAMDEDNIEEIVKTMVEMAAPPYNEITDKDIVVAYSEVKLNNGTLAQKITFQCLKECYLEGPAFAINQYFVETGDTIFLLEAKTATTDKTDTLLLIAEQVVKTFETNW